MSAILEEGIGFGGNTSQFSTDVIISQYESIMGRNIAAKSLKSTTTGEPPTFTKEEMAYLTKKAVDESSFSEVKIITPSPTITLKKGNTEINVKNAAEVVKKMEEKYPLASKPLSEKAEAETEIANTLWKEAAVYNSKGELEEVIKNPHFVVPTTPVRQPTETKSVNKNAYEIRNEVLRMSLEFFKWQYEMKVQIDRENNILVDGKDSPTSEKALEMANKFYKFVEQRR
jgi:hypothetical protein